MNEEESESINVMRMCNNGVKNMKRLRVRMVMEPRKRLILLLKRSKL